MKTRQSLVFQLKLQKKRTIFEKNKLRCGIRLKPLFL